MNRWSRRSLKNLSTCHEDIIFLFTHVLQVFDCSIICGYRNEEDQHKAFINKFSKVDWPDGKHNAWPSNAVDVCPYLPDIRIDGNNPKHLKYFYSFSGHVLGIAAEMFNQGSMAHRLRFGGDWDSDKNMDDQTFNDLYHYGLVGVINER